MRYIVLSLLFVLPSLGLCAEQISKTEIRNISIYDGYVVIRLVDPGTNTESCTKTNAEEYVAIRFSSQGSNEMYSAVLSARIANKKIGFGVSGCKSWGAGTVPEAYRVDL